MRSLVLVLVMVTVGCKDDEPKVPTMRPPQQPRVERAPAVARMTDTPSNSSSSSSSATSKPAKASGSGRCLRTARALFRQAKQCGIDIGARTAEKTCAELLADNFTDDMAVKRMAIMTADGCTSLRTAIENDRI